MERQDLARNRINTLFGDLKQYGAKGLITYITAGDPDLDTTEQLVLTLDKAGADLVELGVPFSDPVADGPVIQRASERALAKGVSLSKILTMVARLRESSQIPLVLMTYYNPLLSLGLAEFARQAAQAGVDGVIVPDLPVEECRPLLQVLRQNGLVLVPLAAPTSTDHRLTAMGEVADGFIYCVSLTGVTGAREELPLHLAEYLERVRNCCRQPLAIGFGISTPEQAARVAQLGDAVIVGSAIVRLVERYAGQSAQMLEQVSVLVRLLKAAVL